MSFIAELKRRNVFKVAVAYIIIGWLTMQAGDTLAPALHLPEWVNSLLVFFLLLGFPLALFFAWAFEMTPEGLKKEKDVDRSRSVTSVTGQKLNSAIIGVLVLALGYFAVDKLVLDPGRDAAEIAAAVRIAKDEAIPSAEPGETSNSIAVLPFVNMSDDAANEYFSDGLSEELLNLLAKIPELKVAARTSSFHFKGKTGEIADIGRQLKVANVLEGSVRKSGNQVRITAQLIKADDGYHLWSETYDRTLDNIFVVQDEIATAVVAALKITLLGETSPVTRETNPEAYALFLQGRYWYNLINKENMVKSVDAYQRAIDIDPGFAPAWAGLAISTLHRAGQGWIELEAGVTKAYEAAKHSVTLDPELALGWVSMSQIQGNYRWNWSESNESMQRALELEPNASYVLTEASALAKSLGRMKQAVAHARKASAMDPLNQHALSALAARLEAAGLLQEAEKIQRHLYTLNPDYAGVNSTIAWILLRQGNTEQALAALEDESDNFWRSLIEQLALFSLGKHAEADALLNIFVEKYHTHGAYQIAEIYGWQNRPDEAFQWLEKAYDQHDPGLGSLLKDATLLNLHGDPRWEILVEKIGLLEAWKTMPTHSTGQRQ